MFLLYILFIKFQIIFGLVLEFIFEMKVLQKNLLVSLMVHQVLTLCCLDMFRIIDKGFALNIQHVV